MTSRARRYRLFTSTILAAPLFFAGGLAHAFDLTAIESGTAQEAGQTMVDALLGPTPALTVVPGSIDFIGRIGPGQQAQSGTFTNFNLTPSAEFAGSRPTLTLPGGGIFLTSGTANMPNSNTVNNFSVSPGTGSNAMLTELSGTNTNDQNVLTFMFTLPTGMNAVSANFVFGTDEYPTQSVTDIFGFFVDGVNYAFFPDGSLVANHPDAQFVDNFDQSSSPPDASPYPHEFNGITMPHTVVGLVDPDLDVHTLVIALADTSDTIFDSGVWLSMLHAVFATEGGIGVLPTLVSTFPIYASRDALLSMGRSFADHMGMRLTARLQGPNHPPAAGSGQPLMEYAQAREETTTFSRVVGADWVSPATAEFTMGGLNGFLTLQGDYSRSRYDAPFDNYNRRGFSGTFGLDYDIRPGVLLGVAGSYHDQTASSRTNADRVKARAFSLGTYGGIQLTDQAYVDFTASYTWGKLNTERNTAAGVATGTTRAGNFTITATGGMLFDWDMVTLNPNLNVGYSNIRQNAFTESGPGAVTWARNSWDVVWATPRLDVYLPIRMDGGTLTPTVGIGARLQNAPRNQTVTAIIGATENALAVPNMDTASLVAAAGVGFRNTAGNVALHAGYTGTFGKTLHSHTASVRLKIAF